MRLGLFLKRFRAVNYTALGDMYAATEAAGSSSREDFYYSLFFIFDSVASEGSRFWREWKRATSAASELLQELLHEQRHTFVQASGAPRMLHSRNNKRFYSVAPGLSRIAGRTIEPRSFSSFTIFFSSTFTMRLIAARQKMRYSAHLLVQKIGTLLADRYRFS